MQVNKNSWHYKLLTEKFCFMTGWDERNVSRSLCLYFWQVMFRLFLGVALGLVAVSPLVTGVAMILGLTIADTGTLGGLLVVTGFVLTCMLTVVGTIVSIAYGITYMGEFIVGKLPPKKHKAKEPNIFVEYIKAKKSKVCPIIEFVEEE